MYLRNKTILIISPNYWGKMMVSKHHYAIELARRGNLVYFLNPPNLKKKYFELSKIEENLYLIDYKPIFRAKRLSSFIFSFLVKIQANLLIKKIKKPIDIIWSFDSSIYMNLKHFKAKFYIYFIADNADKKVLIKISKSANLIISISDILFESINQFKDKQLLIEHGLPNCFLNIQNFDIQDSKKIRAAFIGNLFKRGLDRKTFKELINENPEIEFYIYGAIKISESNLSGQNTLECLQFVEYLKIKTNVVLKGIVEPEKLSKEMKTYDLFLFVENPMADINRSSNAHKLVEYLSTGKVIVSNHVISYKNKKELIEMVDEMHNENLPALFKKVISNIDYYNGPELQRKRIEYALNNTYEKQIDRIELHLNELNTNESKRIN
jgi:glycosyltransferase involved in cell wall biosynthesis